MNIFKKSVLKFILSFLTIIFIDIFLLVITTNYIRSQQSAMDIIKTVSSNIIPENNTYKVSLKGKELIEMNNLWVMIIDQDSGKEKFNINKPMT